MPTTTIYNYASVTILQHDCADSLHTAHSCCRSDVAPQSVIDLRCSRARSLLGGAMTFV
eukprot:COSAG05_NODE_167_length_15185_cov_7.875779_2_plen_59_part_00